MSTIYLHNSLTVDYVEGWSYLRAILEGMELARTLPSGRAEIDRKYFKGVTFPERDEEPFKWEGLLEDPRFIINDQGILRLFGKRLAATYDITTIINGLLIADYSGMMTVDDVHAVEKAYDIPESSELMGMLRSPLPRKPFKRFQFKKKSDPAPPATT